MSDFGKVFLCRPDFSKIGVINGINENTASLTESISDPWELSFEVHRYEGVDGELIETDYYQSLNEWMFLYLQTYDGKDAYFIIDNEPEVSSDGNNETKNVTAHSIEVELQTKFLRGILMNTGTTGDQNTLVGFYDSDGVFHNKNLNPYTNLPIEYLVVYNRNAEKLTQVLEDVIAFDLDVNSDNGLISYNQEAYEYLFDIYQKYPRLICDVQDDGSDKIYLNIIDNPTTPLGYDIYVGHDFIYNSETGEYNPTDEPYSVDYLLNGLRSLISYYEKYGNQLSILSLAFELAEASGWSVGEVPEQIADKKYSFKIDGTQDLLSFFKTTFTQTAKVIVDFDKKARKINIVDVQDEDAERQRDTGVFVSYHNLLNEVSVSSSSEDGLRTQYVPTGANGLGVLFANFGEDKILNLDWLVNKVNEYGDYQYVSSDLHDKYRRWISYREDEPIDITINYNDVIVKIIDDETIPVLKEGTWYTLSGTWENTIGDNMHNIPIQIMYLGKKKNKGIFITKGLYSGGWCSSNEIPLTGTITYLDLYPVNVSNKFSFGDFSSVVSGIYLPRINMDGTVFSEVPNKLYVYNGTSFIDTYSDNVLSALITVANREDVYGGAAWIGNPYEEVRTTQGMTMQSIWMVNYESDFVHYDYGNVRTIAPSINLDLTKIEVQDDIISLKS